MVTQVMYIFFAKRKGGIKVSTQYIPNLKEKDYKKIQLDPSRSSLPCIFSDAFLHPVGGIEAGGALLADEELQAWYSYKIQCHG